MKLAEAWALAGNKTRAEQALVELRTDAPNDNEIFMALKNLSARKTLDEGGYEALADGKGSYRDILKDKAGSVRLEQENRQVKAQDTTEELIADWEGRLKAEPNNVKMLRNLAETYAQRNDFDKALGYFERLAVIDGGNDSALQKQISDVKVRRFNHALSQLDQSAPDYAEQAAQTQGGAAGVSTGGMPRRGRRNTRRIWGFGSSWDSFILRPEKSARPSAGIPKGAEQPAPEDPVDHLSGEVF